jgi:hypothetical protein
VAAKKTPLPKHSQNPGRRGLSLSLHPLTMDQAVDAMFKLSKEEAKEITGGKVRRKK